jgi:undecaprenyl-diphosphatase
MTALQAMVLAIVQGITELFPISSLGHAVILPALLGWKVNENDPGFLPFLVVMHLGTAIALLLYFWRTWLEFATAVLIRRGPRAAAERRLLLKVVVATIPAVIIGGLLAHHLGKLFGQPSLVAGILIVNGVMLFVADRLRGRAHTEVSLDRLRWRDALIIGLWQCLALIPGLSRSGATMAGGYLSGLNHEDAAKFSFLTATPIIVAATVLEAPKLLKHGMAHGAFSHTAIAAGAAAGVVAFASTAIIMRWFRSNDARGFDPFALYCGLAGAVALAWLTLHH